MSNCFDVSIVACILKGNAIVCGADLARIHEQEQVNGNRVISISGFADGAVILLHLRIRGCLTFG